jgi:HEAT repeat protein
VVFDIGRREQNPRVRAMAWDSLRGAPPNEAFVPVLIADLTGHPDKDVRALAAQVLERYAGNPDVHAAFEQALIDQSIEVRRIAVHMTQLPGK